MSTSLPSTQPARSQQQDSYREGEPRSRSPSPTRSPPPRSATLGSFCFSGLVHRGGPPGFLPPPEEQRVLMREPHACPSLLSPHGPLGEATEAQRQRAWWTHSDADSMCSRGCSQQTSAPPPYSAWDHHTRPSAQGCILPGPLPAPPQLHGPCLETPGVSCPLSSSRLRGGEKRSSTI